MGLLVPSKIVPATTFREKVPVRFKTEKPGVYRDGEFIAVFKRLPQSEVDQMQDNNLPFSEVLDEVLEKVEGIGISESEEMPADQAMEWVKTTPECVNAAATVFFQSMRPERALAKTSSKRR